MVIRALAWLWRVLDAPVGPFFQSTQDFHRFQEAGRRITDLDTPEAKSAISELTNKP